MDPQALGQPARCCASHALTHSVAYGRRTHADANAHGPHRPSPQTQGGERPIALTAMLYRLAIKMRQPIIGDWQTREHGFWDSAIKGSSCLRAALARAFRMEAGVAAGFVAIAELWDVGAFYDSIRIHNLVDLALDKNFPVQVLNMSLAVHTASRAFREGPYMSSWVLPGGFSIIAGCGTSVDFTRPLLYNIMDKLHRDFFPRGAVQNMGRRCSPNCSWQRR